MSRATRRARRVHARVLRVLRSLVQGDEPTTFMRVAYRVPRQVILVTAQHGAKRALWPVDWHMPVGFHPPRYALSCSRGSYGTAVLREAGSFVVNMVAASFEPIILAAGSTSGADTDKFQALGVATFPAAYIDAPCVAGAIGRLECRVEDVREWDDRVLVVGRVLHSEDTTDPRPRLHHEWTG